MSNKLKCIITGRKLIATKAYYVRKVEKAGGEEELHRTYICREAKNLLKQGTTVDRVREILGTEDVVGDIDQEIIDSLLTSDKRAMKMRINNLVSVNKIINTQTDPEVKKYINNITK